MSLAQGLISSASAAEKREVLQKIENCSKREAQEVLAQHFPESKPPKESLKFISGGEASLHVRLSQETITKLDKIKNRRAHKNPGMNYSELIEDMCDYMLRKLTPPRKTKATTPSKNPRYIPAQLKAKIFQRDQNQCTFISPLNQQRCTSKHQLQIDHKQPISKGGQSTEQNLRLLCPAHHKYVDQFI